jgi:hypothetical protein
MTKKRKKRYKEKAIGRKGEIEVLSVIGHPAASAGAGCWQASLPEGWRIRENDF